VDQCIGVFVDRNVAVIQKTLQEFTSIITIYLPRFKRMIVFSNAARGSSLLGATWRRTMFKGQRPKLDEPTKMATR